MNWRSFGVFGNCQSLQWGIQDFPDGAGHANPRTRRQLIIWSIFQITTWKRNKLGRRGNDQISLVKLMHLHISRYKISNNYHSIRGGSRISCEWCQTHILPICLREGREIETNLVRRMCARPRCPLPLPNADPPLCTLCRLANQHGIES